MTLRNILSQGSSVFLHKSVAYLSLLYKIGLKEYTKVKFYCTVEEHLDCAWIFTVSGWCHYEYSCMVFSCMWPRLSVGLFLEMWTHRACEFSNLLENAKLFSKCCTNANFPQSCTSIIISLNSCYVQMKSFFFSSGHDLLSHYGFSLNFSFIWTLLKLHIFMPIGVISFLWCLFNLWLFFSYL